MKDSSSINSFHFLFQLYFSLSLIHSRKKSVLIKSLQFSFALVLPNMVINLPNILCLDISPCGSNDMIFTGQVYFRFSSLILSFYLQNKTELGCKECEELEEKSIKEFLKSFVHIVQMFINTSWLQLILFRISIINKHLSTA